MNTECEGNQMDRWSQDKLSKNIAQYITHICTHITFSRSYTSTSISEKKNKRLEKSQNRTELLLDTN